jgi:hypothetical protein
LASQLGVGFFDEKLGALCMQWLQDKVCISTSCVPAVKSSLLLVHRTWKFLNLGFSLFACLTCLCSMIKISQVD